MLILHAASVLLQPMKEDPPAGAKCKDKFLVQSVVITPEREAKALSELVRRAMIPLVRSWRRLIWSVMVAAVVRGRKVRQGSRLQGGRPDLRAKDSLRLHGDE